MIQCYFWTYTTVTVQQGENIYGIDIFYEIIMLHLSNDRNLEILTGTRGVVLS